MKLKRIQLGGQCAYRDPVSKKLTPITIVSLRTLLSGKGGRTEALANLPDGSEYWIDIGSVLPFEALPIRWNKSIPSKPTNATRHYWIDKSLAYIENTVNPSESWFVDYLKDRAIDFAYEPTAFDFVDTNKSFRPDFYLPEIDLYVELTAVKRSKACSKRKKLCNIEAYYPEISVVVIYWEELLYLAQNQLTRDELISYLHELLWRRAKDVEKQNT